MDFIILLEHIEVVRTRLNSYWNLYIIILLAIGTILFQRQQPFTYLQIVVINTGLILFFISNFSALYQTYNYLKILLIERKKSLVNVKIQSEELRREFCRDKTNVKRSLLFHLLIDTLIFLAVVSQPNLLFR